MFEESTVRWLAEIGVPAELGPTLEAHLEGQKAMSDPLEFVRADFAFHHMIVAAGGNLFATALFNQTGPRLLRYWFGIARAGEARARIVTENAALADTVVAADLDGYKALLSSHPELSRGFGVTISS
jgi:DNA-binding GntR family transcriptional regulator